jgi:hypothetical protein
METLGGGPMLSIEGLNKKQMAMMNVIWSCNDEDQFMNWFLSLTQEDRCTVESLLIILKQEYLEMVVRDSSMDNVKEILKRISHGPTTEG